MMAMGLTLVGLVGGAICGGIVMHAYRSSGYPAFSIHRLTYAFTDFHHAHQTLIVVGLVVSLIMAFTGVFLTRRALRRYRREIASSRQ